MSEAYRYIYSPSQAVGLPAELVSRRGVQYRMVDIIDDATSDKSEDEDEPGFNTNGALDCNVLFPPGIYCAMHMAHLYM